MSNPSLRRTTALAAALAIGGALAGIQNPISETRGAADERRYTVIRDRSQKQRKDGPTVDRGKRRAKNKQARQSRAKNRR